MNTALDKPVTSPLVSIGVASFNNAAYITETLDSINYQTYSNWELLIVDDASTDESVRVISDWLEAHPAITARLIQNPLNRGICHTFNRFLSEAKGEYISIIGSDDRFLSNKLSRQVTILEGAPADTGVVYSDVSKINARGDIIEPSVYATGQIKPFSGDVWLEMLKTNFLGAMTVLIRRECFTRLGFFDEQLAYEDWDMWLRISREYNFVYQPEVTCHYRIHGASVLHKKRPQIIESSLLLLQKQAGISAAGDVLIAGHLRDLSEQLYLLGSPASTLWLRRSWQQHRHLRGLALLAASQLGVPASTVSHIFGVFKRLIGRVQAPTASAR